MPDYDCLIVGGGAAVAVEEINDVDQGASIGMISEELSPSCKRPPLSKVPQLVALRRLLSGSGDGRE